MREGGKAVCGLLLLQLFFFSFTALMTLPAMAKEFTVPSPTYPTIQSALNAAKDGDIIRVSSGYVGYENLDITDAVQLIGADKDTTIIDGRGVGNVIYVEDSGVKITGFTIRNGNNGIRVRSTYGTVNITGNIIKNNRYGISMIGDPPTAPTSDNTILANTFLNNSEVSISVTFGLTTTISRNQISGSAYGIKLAQTNSSTISLNTLSDNSYGIQVSGSTGNNVLANTQTNDQYGTILDNSTGATVQDNLIQGSTYGLQLRNSDGNTILHNNVSSNPSYGLYLYLCKTNTVANNTLSRNRWGLYLYNSSINPVIRGNTISLNTYGITTMGHARDNTIYQNNFISNIVQITRDAESPNGYYNITLQRGNYWSDYRGEDNGAGGRVAGDGVGDTLIPHLGVDLYPLMGTWPTPKHDVSIAAIYESTTIAYVGQVISIDVVASNDGSFTETFNVTLQNNVTSIGEIIIPNLAPNTNTTITFDWNTTGVQPGYYEISATAEPVTGETGSDLEDNTMTDGVIQLTNEPLIGDINSDSYVNQDDLILFNQAYGSTAGLPPSSNWNPNADLNEDGIIDDQDLTLLGHNYGRHI